MGYNLWQIQNLKFMISLIFHISYLLVIYLTEARYCKGQSSLGRFERSKFT